MLSRGSNGSCLASLVPKDENREETIADGATPALALLVAYAGAILSSVGDLEPGDGRFYRPPSARLN